MHALVTGATGFVGSHLSEALLARGWTVRCATRPSSNLRWLASLAVDRIDVDWRNAGSLARATADVDVVFHVAGVLSGAAVEAYAEGNVAQTGRLLAATPDAARFVYVSSLAASGPAPGKAPVVERDPCRPISVYGRSKHEAEMLLWRERGRRAVTVVRPPVVIGPRDEGLLELAQILNRGINPRVGGPKRLSVVFVDDLVEGLIAAAGPAGAGETFFLAHAEPVTQVELAGAFLAALGRRAIPLPIPEPLLHLAARMAEWGGAGGRFGRDKAREMTQAAWVCSPAAARRVLGWEARTSLAAAVERTVTWYRAAGWL